MTSLAPRTKSCPAPACADPCEPAGTSVAVSVKNAFKTKCTAKKPTKCTPSLGKDHKVFGRVKNLIRKKPASKACCAWPSSEVLLCNLLAWVGALVIVVVVFRSLYLMYCKPEEI